MVALLCLPSGLLPYTYHLYIFYLARNDDDFNLIIRRYDGRGYRFVSFRCIDESDDEWLMVAFGPLLSGWTQKPSFIHSFCRRIS